MEMQNMGWKGPVTRIAMSLAVAVVTSFYRMAKARLVFYRLKKQGMVRNPVKLPGNFYSNYLSQCPRGVLFLGISQP
jgi:hypothetical protein